METPQQLIVPQVRMMYRADPKTGVRVIVGIEIAGHQFGGVVSISTGADLSRPSAMPVGSILTELRVVWPFEWKDVSTPDILVATRMNGA
jgi:hypothetical protein